MNRKPSHLVRVTKTVRLLPETIEALEKLKRRYSIKSLGKTIDYLAEK
jgi:hypothetical protein